MKNKDDDDDDPLKNNGNSQNLKTPIVYSLIDHEIGTDIFTDTLYNELEAIPAISDLDYPLDIEAERAEMDIDPECMAELLRMLHGAETKLSVVTDFKEK